MGSRERERKREKKKEREMRKRGNKHWQRFLALHDKRGSFAPVTHFLRGFSYALKKALCAFSSARCPFGGSLHFARPVVAPELVRLRPRSLRTLCCQSLTVTSTTSRFLCAPPSLFAAFLIPSFLSSPLLLFLLLLPRPLSRTLVFLSLYLLFLAAPFNLLPCLRLLPSSFASFLVSRLWSKSPRTFVLCRSARACSTSPAIFTSFARETAHRDLHFFQFDNFPPLYTEKSAFFCTYFRCSSSNILNLLNYCCLSFHLHFILSANRVCVLIFHVFLFVKINKNVC